VNRLKNVVIAGIVLCCPMIVNAEGYLGVSVVQFSVVDSEPGFNLTTKPAGAMLVWSSELNNYFGLDIRYGVSGDDSNAPLTMNVSVVSQFLKPQYKVSEDAKVYVLLGYSSLSVGRTVQGFNEEVAKKLALSYGVGASMEVTDKWEASFEWVNYIKDVQVGAPGVDIKLSISGIAAGIGYLF